MCILSLFRNLLETGIYHIDEHNIKISPLRIEIINQYLNGGAITEKNVIRAICDMLISIKYDFFCHNKKFCLYFEAAIDKCQSNKDFSSKELHFFQKIIKMDSKELSLLINNTTITPSYIIMGLFIVKEILNDFVHE